MNAWLGRLSTWKFAVLWGVCMFLLVGLAVALVQWLVKGRVDISYLIGSGLGIALATGMPAAIKQRSRHLR